MKKILNCPDAYVDETLDGLCAAHPQYYVRHSARVIKRAALPSKRKVGVVSGGGSGHLPVFTGYVGPGLLDACAVGNVFSSPSAEQMADAMRASFNGEGVLRVYGNYGGDVMNFDMAGEIVEAEGIASTTVLVTDDLASAAPCDAEKRRGVAGLIYAFKVAGAASEEGGSLASVTEVAKRAVRSCRSIGVALSPCTVPHAGKPTFEMKEGDMEMGMGIHGEPGIERTQLKNADQIADQMLDRILADMPLSPHDRVSLLVNSLGATPAEELYILYRRIAQRLRDHMVEIVSPLVGRYATSMEMTGASLTLLRVDAELEKLLKAPAECAFWKV